MSYADDDDTTEQYESESRAVVVHDATDELQTNNWQQSAVDS